jgi:hypothetical protein
MGVVERSDVLYDAFLKLGSEEPQEYSVIWSFSMKRMVAALIVGSALVLPLAAQSAPQGENRGYYYTNVTLERVYPANKGYIVLYRQEVGKTGRLYLPYEWFSHSAAGKADVVYLETGAEWPSLSIYYRNGQFSHLRLYVRREATHETWGYVPNTVDTDRYFENVEDLHFEFNRGE